MEIGWILVALHLHINEFELSDCEFIRKGLVLRFEDRKESFHMVLFWFFLD